MLTLVLGGAAAALAATSFFPWSYAVALTGKKAYDKLEEEGFVTTVHGKGTYVSASDKQLALEARQKAIEDDFDKVIDRALSMGMKKEEISEVVKLILDEK